MKFEIECDDMNKAETLLNEFAKICEDEYRKQLESVKSKLETLKKIGIARSSYALPDDVMFIVFKEEDKLVFRNSIPLPKVIRLMGRPVKKMENNLRKFLEMNDVKVFDVRYAGD